MTAMTAPSRPDAPVPADAVQSASTPGAPGREDEGEALHRDAAGPDPAPRHGLRHVTRLGRLKALVARFEARHLGHRVAMHVARGHEDARPHAAARWPDSFFEP
jgi:hypothetical protein